MTTRNRYQRIQRQASKLDAARAERDGEIRRRARSGEALAAIAREMGVSRQRVQQIVAAQR